MDHIHKRFTSEQVKNLFGSYCQGLLDRTEIENILGLRQARFFALLRQYRQDPEGFSITYKRTCPLRLSASVEKELYLEKSLIEAPELPISSYNYSAIKDRLLKRGVKISGPTIIDRAKALGCYRAKPKKKTHDREVVTTAVGALIQHDASHHRWSPYAQEKWVLISSMDDFFETETSWAHIQATEAVLRRYGLPFRSYVDSWRVFRFVRDRDSFWYKPGLKTDEAEPQWKQVMRTMGVDIIYALSPQAKGKIERSYRWFQDRVVRTAAIEKLSTIEEVRPVLQEEIHRYNHLQIHATTGEIPHIRFEKARKSGPSLFRPFSLPHPYTSTKDVFCLRETRTVNAYRKILLYNHDIHLSQVRIGDEVEIHFIPNLPKRPVEVRIWWHNQTVQKLVFPITAFPRVHF